MLEPVLYIGIAQSIFAGLVLTVRKPQSQADRYLGTLLFIIGIEMLLALAKLKWLDYLPYEIPFLVLPFLYGPLVYLYVRTLITEHPQWNWRDFLHFTPFILFLGLSFLFKTSPDETGSLPVWAHATRLASIIIEILIFTSFTFYSVLAYILLTRHRRAIQEEFSYTSGKIKLTWLLFMSITIYVSYALTFLSAGIQMFIIRLPFDPKIFSFTGLTLISFAFSFYGHRQMIIYADHKPRNDDKEPGSLKYAKSGLSQEELQRYAEAMDQLMQTDHLYLNPELSLAEVSEALNIPRHHLTQALNTVTGKNFYTYINELRVKRFMDAVIDPKNRDFTFLSIAFDCGFNSKSTFNSVFKRITGFTPSEYLKTVDRL